MTTENTSPELLTLTEAAKALRISLPTLRNNLIKNNRISVIQMGKKKQFVTRAALNAFLNQHT